MDFQTGVTIVVVNAEISRVRGPAGESQVNHRELTMVELQEAVHALSRFNVCRWYSRETGRPLASLIWESLAEQNGTAGDRDYGSTN